MLLPVAGRCVLATIDCPLSCAKSSNKAVKRAAAKQEIVGLDGVFPGPLVHEEESPFGCLGSPEEFAELRDSQVSNL